MIRKPKYRVGQTVLLPCVIDHIDLESTNPYFLEIEEDLQYTGLELIGSINEEELMDIIEFSDPDIKRKKITDKIEQLQQQLKEIK